MSLSVLAFLVSIGTVAGLLKLGTSAMDNEDTAEAGTITPVVSSDELTIELADEPVFAVLPVELTVAEATEAGYTLTAFAESTDLVSTTDSSKVIPMIAVDEGELAALADNTYGLALAEPTSQDEEVYTALSTDADNPTLLAEKEEGTEANDTTTIYYGFYITPDVPYGTYTSGDVYYDVEANKIATVTFDGNNKFYFGDDASQATNAVTYVSGKQGVPQYSHTPNISDAGVQNGSYPLGEAETSIITVPGFQKIHITLSYGDGIGYYSDDWVSLWPGSNPTYTAADNYNTGLNMGSVDNGKYIFNSSYSPTPITTVNGDIDGEMSDYAVTFAYKTTTNSGGSGEHTGYGYYAIVTGYDPNVAISGEYEVPTANGTYRFLGWDTNPEATTPTYTSEADIERLDLSSGAPVKLYAISEPAYVIYYDGNGADSTTNMDSVEQYTTNLESTAQQVDLLASNYKRAGYGFAGWSTDANAWDHLTNDDESDNPTIYGPNQTITVNPSASTKLNLYAVWVPVAKSNGEPVELQNWQGCSSLTPTTYNDGVLTVGKNTVTALKDSRDGNVYTVARLADGNCWMTENLRLDNEPELSANNTHNPNLPLTNNYEEQIKSNKLSASSDSWCNSWSTAEERIACYDHSNLNTNNVADTATSPSFSQDFTSEVHKNFSGNIASYGNYYNWYSSTAGQGTYSVSSGNASGDICPKGWQLPYGGSSTSTGGGKTKGGFYYLNQQMGNDTSSLGSNNWRSFPNNFVYSGLWNGSSALDRGYHGYYWSSTAYDNDRAYGLYLSSGGVNPGNYLLNKYYGVSVRCVAPVQ